MNKEQKHVRNAVLPSRFPSSVHLHVDYPTQLLKDLKPLLCTVVHPNIVPILGYTNATSATSKPYTIVTPYYPHREVCDYVQKTRAGKEKRIELVSKKPFSVCLSSSREIMPSVRGTDTLVLLVRLDQGRRSGSTLPAGSPRRDHPRGLERRTSTTKPFDRSNSY